MSLFFLFTALCYLYCTTAQPTAYPISCIDNLIEVGPYHRCLRYEEKPVCYDKAQKKCLEDGGALAALTPDIKGIDKIEVEVNKHQGNESDPTIWIVREQPPENQSKWDAYCLSFKNGTVQDCSKAACKHFNYFCEFYKYNPCGGDNATNQGWFYRDGQCFKAIYRPEGFTFFEARSVCQEVQAKVATVNSRSKNELIQKLLEVEGQLKRSSEDLYDAWIGLNLVRLSSETKNATWENGDQDNHLLDEDRKGKYPWAPGEPNNAHDNEMCVQVNTNKDKTLWNDRNCDAKLKTVICSRSFTFPTPGS